MTKVASITGSAEMKKNAERFHKVNRKMILIEKIFRPFVGNDWCFESRMIPYIMDSLSPEERVTFNANPSVIDWNLAS